MRIGVAHTPMETRRDVIVDTAVLAEALGFDTFSLAEGWGYDSAALLAAIAMRTERITLMPGVFSVWSRTPAAIAMAAATLNELSGGRATLGLGASTQALTEGMHGVPFTRPAARLRDTAIEVRKLLAGERTAGGLKLGVAAQPDLPIWLAATGKLTLEAVAETADGWCPFFLTTDGVRARAAQLRAAGTRPLTVSSNPLVVAGPGSRAIAGAVLAWYVCAMGDVYSRLMTEQGYGKDVDAIRAANPRPHPTRSIVPDEATAALDAFTVYGSAEEVRRKLEPWADCSDIVTATLPAGMPWENIDATMRAVAGRD